MNPELRRNLWLELSVHRLVAMPLVLALVFVLFYVMEPSNGAKRIAAAALGAFVVVAHLWGARRASESIVEELRERTWDWQRLSSLAPWQMAWGKLAGATAFQWYGGLICLAVLLPAMWAARWDDAGWLALFLVASAIALHGSLFAATLQQARKSPRHANRTGALLLIPVLIVISGLWSALAPRPGSEVAWYASRTPSMEFAALSACAFAAWSLLAAHREMSRELRVLRAPWAYPAFTLFMVAYVAGFFRAGEPHVPFALAGFTVSGAMFYYALFAEETTPMSLRRLSTFAARGDWRRAADAVPLWVPAAVLAVAFGLACAFVALKPPGAGGAPLGATAVAMALLVPRDAAILLFFALAPKPRRYEAVTLLYLALLYWIVPGILAASGLAVLAGIVSPYYLDGWAAALAAAAHVAVAGALAGWRWRQTRERFERAGSPAV